MFLTNITGSAKDKTRLADWFVKQQVPGTVEPITLRSDKQVERKVFELVQRIYQEEILKPKLPKEKREKKPKHW